MKNTLLWAAPMKNQKSDSSPELVENETSADSVARHYEAHMKHTFGKGSSGTGVPQGAREDTTTSPLVEAGASPVESTGPDPVSGDVQEEEPELPVPALSYSDLKAAFIAERQVRLEARRVLHTCLDAFNADCPEALVELAKKHREDSKLIASLEDQLSKAHSRGMLGKYVADDSFRTWAERDAGMRDRITDLEAQLSARDGQWQSAYNGTGSTLGPRSPEELRVFLDEAAQVDREQAEHERRTYEQRIAELEAQLKTRGSTWAETRREEFVALLERQVATRTSLRSRVKFVKFEAFRTNEDGSAVYIDESNLTRAGFVRTSTEPDNVEGEERFDFTTQAGNTALLMVYVTNGLGQHYRRANRVDVTSALKEKGEIAVRLAMGSDGPTDGLGSPSAATEPTGRGVE